MVVKYDDLIQDTEASSLFSNVDLISLTVFSTFFLLNSLLQFVVAALLPLFTTWNDRPF